MREERVFIFLRRLSDRKSDEKNDRQTIYLIEIDRPQTP